MRFGSAARVLARCKLTTESQSEIVNGEEDDEYDDAEGGDKDDRALQVRPMPGLNVCKS